MSDTPLPVPTRSSIVFSGVAGAVIGALVGQVGVAEVIVLALLCAAPLPVLAVHRRKRLARPAAANSAGYEQQLLLHRRSALTFVALSGGILIAGVLCALAL